MSEINWDKADEITNVVQDQWKEGVELTDKLKRSQALQRLFPDIFEDGVSVTVKFTSRYPHKWPRNYWIHVTTSDGGKRVIHLFDYQDDPNIDDLATGRAFLAQAKSPNRRSK